MSAADLFPALDAAKEAALRASIRRFGVINPVLYDQHGELVDGAHRTRLAAEEGKDCPSAAVVLPDDPDERRAALVSLNNDRRQAMEPTKRREVVKALREEGHSQRAIAGAIGVSQRTIVKDLAQLSTGTQLDEPKRVVGLDGKSRPASQQTKPKPEPTPAPNTRAAINAAASKRKLGETLASIAGYREGIDRFIRIGEALNTATADDLKEWKAIATTTARTLNALARQIKEVQDRAA